MNEINVINNSNEIIESISFEDELFARWINFIDVKERTIETYTKALKQFFSYLADNNIKQPTRADIIAYREYLSISHRPTTVQNYIVVVKQFFKWTAMENIYPNIAEHVKGAKLDKEFKKDYLTTKQVKKLLRKIDTTTLKGKRDYALIVLMITTGLRTIEVERANIEDLRNVGDFTALYIQGKGHDEKSQYVKVSEPVEEAIRSYLTSRGSLNDSSPLFASVSKQNKGNRLTTRSIRRIVKDKLIAAGLNSNRLTAHSLRHTTATLNLLNGGTPEETMQLLRHTNLNTTLIYAHSLERAKNKSEYRITKAIFK